MQFCCLAFHDTAPPPDHEHVAPDAASRVCVGGPVGVPYDVIVWSFRSFSCFELPA